MFNESFEKNGITKDSAGKLFNAIAKETDFAR
jgi:hypothetical protein